MATTPTAAGWTEPHSYSNNDPKDLLKFSQYIYHSHAKFYEMTEEFKEYSIPYDEIIAVLKEIKFAGYLSSEYEGQRHTNDIIWKRTPSSRCAESTSCCASSWAKALPKTIGSDTMLRHAAIFALCLADF